MLHVPPSDAQLADLEAALGYQFADRRLLVEALLHPSYHQGGQPNNYRLAWLGDAVLTMVASSELFEERSGGWGLPAHTAKGELHNRREQAKTNAACAGFALDLSLDQMLVVGRAYWSQAPSDRMLAEAFEAVLGAVWEDSNHSFDAVSSIYHRVAGH